MIGDPTDYLPQRNNGLVARITALWSRAQPNLGPQPSERDTTATGSTSGEVARRAYEWGDFFKTSTDRQAQYDDVEEMDDQSEEASTALDIIADNATTSDDGQMQSFTITAKSERAQACVDQTIQNCRLHSRINSIARGALKYGDLFAEIVTNGEAEVTDIKVLPPRTMYRNEDRKGNLMMGTPKYQADGKCLNNKGECAYEQQDADNHELIATFFPWQICHMRWNHDGHSKYGRSHLRVARTTWKKLHAEEEALIIGRLVRALLKLVFYIDTTGQSRQQKEETVREFKLAMQRRVQLDGSRENPFNVMTDYYMTKETIPVRGGQSVQSQSKIETIDPRNEGLQQIEDVKHIHRKFTAVLRVPRAYLNFDEDASSSRILSTQDVQFIRFLRRVQRFMGEFITHVIQVGMILEGLDPFAEENKFDISWPALSVNDELSDQQAFYAMAQGVAILLGTSSLNQTPVVTPEYIMKNFLKLSDEQADELVEDLREMADEKHQRSVQLATLGVKPAVPTNVSQMHDKEPPGSVRSRTGVDTSERSVA